jgi:hypothetical protein
MTKRGFWTFANVFAQTFCVSGTWAILIWRRETDLLYWGLGIALLVGYADAVRSVLPYLRAKEAKVLTPKPSRSP